MTNMIVPLVPLMSSTLHVGQCCSHSHTSGAVSGTETIVVTALVFAFFGYMFLVPYLIDRFNLSKGVSVLLIVVIPILIVVSIPLYFFR